MKQTLANIAILVDEYDKAIAFYTGVLGFELLEDTKLTVEKRWVRVAPPGSTGTALLLAKAANDLQKSQIGLQSGGRVFLFLHTDDFDRDYAKYKSSGIEFVREPVIEEYGKVAVFKDVYGNLWDLIGVDYLKMG
jgi:catechol 2,3-dioxygenase-like lactoylglutathione lyase family enzyme